MWTRRYYWAVAVVVAVVLALTLMTPTWIVPLEEETEAQLLLLAVDHSV